MPMRHGLTLGELGHWFIDHYGLDVDYRVIAMQGWAPDAGPGHGWPLGERSWINPSPNAPNLSMARAYAGTVMLEGATLSEGRGTTRPLELFGAPDLDARRVIDAMHSLAPQWLKGCRLRDCWFQPTFHKHVGQLCNGVQIHVDDPAYDHLAFRPWRLQALAFKAIRGLYPDYDLWRDFPYEYVHDRLAIDVINGGPGLREWVDDTAAAPGTSTPWPRRTSGPGWTRAGRTCCTDRPRKRARPRTAPFDRFAAAWLGRDDHAGLALGLEGLAGGLGGVGGHAFEADPEEPADGVADVGLGLGKGAEKRLRIRFSCSRAWDLVLKAPAWTT